MEEETPKLHIVCGSFFFIANVLLGWARRWQRTYALALITYFDLVAQYREGHLTSTRTLQRVIGGVIHHVGRRRWRRETERRAVRLSVELSLALPCLVSRHPLDLLLQLSDAHRKLPQSVAITASLRQYAAC